MFTMTDFRALMGIQNSLKFLDEYTYRDTANNGNLANIWNALLDARSSILDKMLDDDNVNYAGLEEELSSIIAKRQKQVKT